MAQRVMSTFTSICRALLCASVGLFVQTRTKTEHNLLTGMRAQRAVHTGSCTPVTDVLSVLWVWILIIQRYLHTRTHTDVLVGKMTGDVVPCVAASCLPPNSGGNLIIQPTSLLLPPKTGCPTLITSAAGERRARGGGERDEATSRGEIPTETLQRKKIQITEERDVKGERGKKRFLGIIEAGGNLERQMTPAG